MRPLPICWTERGRGRRGGLNATYARDRIFALRITAKAVLPPSGLARAEVLRRAWSYDTFVRGIAFQRNMPRSARPLALS